MAVQIEHTISAWSKAIGVSESTLEVKLTKEGLPNKGLIRARDIISAMAGERDASIIELNREKTAALALARRKEEGELIDLPTVERLIWQELLGPLKQEMDLMPAKLAPLLGDDPVKVLTEWVEETKRKLLKGKR